jgi:abhydrolase domain-containing protein 2
MINSLVRKYPSTFIISVGFSLGGNLITKYLGEKNVAKPTNIIGGISICQGYDAVV